MMTVADAVTLANAACGLLSIMFAATGKFKIAALLLVLAVFLDWADGKIARMKKQTHELGKELDSLSDIVSFGIAPAVFGFLQIQWHPVVTIIIIFFALCGILRLARFNITKNDGFYEGVPITTNGIIFPLIFFAGVPIQFYVYVYLFMGLLMISSFKIKKIL